MWTLKICVIGLSMLCDDTTYTQYITEAQCTQAMRAIETSELNYIAICEKE